VNMLVEIKQNLSNEFIDWCFEWEKAILGVIENIHKDYPEYPEYKKENQLNQYTNEKLNQ